MNWVQNLKQTRSGSIYSETTSSLATLDDRAVKRRKTTSIPADQVPERCHLEALPAELLQQIFLTSVNGNLIRASPVIAVKLSGQPSFYRAAFLLAFFSHDVDKVFDIHRLHYFIPKLELPLSTWDVRSLTKAVLGSRWCNWGRVKSWLSDNLKYAITQMLQMGKDALSRKEMQKFMQGAIDIADLTGTAWWSEDNQQRALQLETNMWDIRLTRDSDTYEDEFDLDKETHEDYERDPYTAEWRNELIFQCQVRILGVLTIGDEKTQNYAPDFSDRAAFRDVVRMYMGLDAEEMKPFPHSLDFFQLLGERALQATRNPHWLRETLAIDYFLWPDDQRYKISPRLYRAAAAADLKLEPPIFRRRGCYLSALYVLFEIDPLSLPRTDPALLCWAGRARRRIMNYRGVLVDLKEDVDKMRQVRGGGILRNSDTNRFRALKLDNKYCYDMDRRILRYMKTGSLTVKVDNRAPSFAEILPWHGEQVKPSVTALEVAEWAACFETDPFDVDIFQLPTPDLELQWYDTHTRMLRW